MLIDMGKTILAKMIHAALRVMLVFPIKRNRVLVMPSNGHYYCNLKYVDEELRKRGAR